MLVLCAPWTREFKIALTDLTLVNRGHDITDLAGKIVLVIYAQTQGCTYIGRYLLEASEGGRG